jgi:type I restriction enzyme, S subunit
MSKIFSEIELPNSWVWAKTKEIGLIINGDRGKNYPSRQHYILEGIPFLSAGNLSDGKINLTTLNFISEEKFNLLNSGKLKRGDIIYCLRGTLGKCASFDLDKKAAIASSLVILRPNDLINNKYLLYNFQGPLGKRLIKYFDNGTAQPNLSGESFANYDIPLPPLPEQHRIVTKIEELFSSLDKGIESLKTAQQQLKVYRQAVLKWAFEGKLTEEWRKNNKDAPDVVQLRKEIRSALEEKANIAGSKIKSIISLTETELAELPRLPDEWCWVKLGEITYSVKDGPHYSPPYQTTGIPFITGGNIRPEGVDFENVKYISKELNDELNKRCKPEVGDILYTKGGTTGIARVNSYDFEFNVWVHVAVLKIVKDIEPFYLQHALNSNHCYKQSQKYTHGVGNQDLGLTRMVNITLPICSLDEQKQVVAEIESRLSVCDKIEESIEQSLKQAESLRQSILKKAFEGKLIPQDPSDPPASELLARIQAERIPRQESAKEGQKTQSRRTSRNAKDAKVARFKKLKRNDT